MKDENTKGRKSGADERHIGGKFHSTADAKVIASGPRMDSTREQFGETFLFRLPDGEFFATHQTFFDSRRDKLEPLTRDRAIALWGEAAAEVGAI